MNPERKEILNLPVLPGRLTPAEAAWRLGFEPDHITVLVSLGLLKPLGHPPASRSNTLPASRLRRCGMIPNGWPKRRMRFDTIGSSRTKPPRNGLATAIHPVAT